MSFSKKKEQETEKGRSKHWDFLRNGNEAKSLCEIYNLNEKDVLNSKWKISSENTRLLMICHKESLSIAFDVQNHRHGYVIIFNQANEDFRKEIRNIFSHWNIRK